MPCYAISAYRPYEHFLRNCICLAILHRVKCQSMCIPIYLNIYKYKRFIVLPLSPDLIWFVLGYPLRQLVMEAWQHPKRVFLARETLSLPKRVLSAEFNRSCFLISYEVLLLYWNICSFVYRLTFLIGSRLEEGNNIYQELLTPTGVSIDGFKDRNAELEKKKKLITSDYCEAYDENIVMIWFK